MESRPQAMSLIEIVVALGVIAFALMTMIGLYVSGIRLMNRGEEITVATEIGRQVLESLKRDGGYHYIPDTNEIYDGRVPDPRNPALDFPPAPYPVNDQYRLWVASELVDPNLKSVTVRVYYDNESHVVLQTYYRP